MMGRTSGHGRGMLAAFTTVCALGALLVIPRQAIAQGTTQEQIVFTKDIAPILQRSCERCHCTNGVGPMPLTTYDFNMVFGYLNRNYEEVVDVPVGPDNNFEPGGTDQGQPTRFFPRRSRFLFRVRVPKDFGNKELVWTLTAHGRTDKAYATLRPEYILDNALIEGGNIGQRKEQNQAPVIKVEGTDHRATVGRPMTLTAHITDDGIPKAPPPGGIETHRAKFGLRAGWFVYRGMGTIAFDPPQSQPFKRDSAAFVPADGNSSVKVTFSQAGTYVLRVTADDGGLFSVRDLTVTAQ